MIPQQIDETKAALKDTEDRLSNGKRFLDFSIGKITGRSRSYINGRELLLDKLRTISNLEG